MKVEELGALAQSISWQSLKLVEDEIIIRLLAILGV